MFLSKSVQSSSGRFKGGLERLTFCSINRDTGTSLSRTSVSQEAQLQKCAHYSFLLNILSRNRKHGSNFRLVT